MLRRIAASYWTALVLGVAAIVLHVRWYTVDKAAGGEVVSGFGAALVVLGVLIGGRAYIRTGIRGAAVQATTFRILTFNPAEHSGDADAAIAAARSNRADEVAPDMVAERVVAVAVVILGTLLNGYGPLVARTLQLH